MTQKEQIIEDSLQQFLTNGIKKMTIKKLLEPMGISTKTFYKYFIDKEDLLKYCVEMYYDKLTSDLSSKNYPNSIYALLDLWSGGFRFDYGVNSLFYSELENYPNIIETVSQKYFLSVSSSLQTILAKGVEEGYFENYISSGIVFETFVILHRAIARTRGLRSFENSAILMFRNTIFVYIKGLCTTKGLVEFNNFLDTNNKELMFAK